ncbi:MAG: family 78 glycoside hydrolase catalytic domain [Planctomycetes bacterium]|nr:family 78 glycoside hydrolase catalytic domain [Planctomycetota bacterium]
MNDHRPDPQRHRPAPTSLTVAALPSLLAAVLTGCLGVATDGAASLHVVELRCEALRDPLAIGTPTPRLSWRVEADAGAPRGLGWDAVQVEVSHDRDGLLSGAHDLWDSGWVEGRSTIGLVYGGATLAARDVGWWRVRIRDGAGRASAWSEPATFGVGLLAESDWSGAWIGTADADGAGRTQAPWLRRSLELPAAPVRALWHVASIGYHDAWVNGRPASDAVLAPSVSDLSERVRSVTYDVTPMLRSGRNAIGLWLGPGWSRYPRYGVPAGPLVRAVLEVELADGRSLRIATDASWRCRRSNVEMIGGWNFGDYGGERVDAGSVVPDWCAADRDDSGWDAVREFASTLAIVPDAVEPNLRVAELRPRSVDEVRPGVWRIDMGQSFTGITRARLRGEPGATIRLSFAEREGQDVTYAQRSELVVGPDGTGTFEHRFDYAAARWITIEGASGPPALDDVRGFLVRTGYANAASFQCDDPLLQRIHDTVAYTFECLSLGGYVVDCAHRERWGYGGDAHATMETALTHFDVSAFYAKWLDDWAAIQDESGNLPFTCPTFRGGGGPAWSGIVVMLPYEVWRRTGDRELLVRCWPTIERWLAFLESKTEDGILQFYFDDRYTRDVYSFLGDWVPPGGAQAGGLPDERRKFFNNAYRVWVVRQSARIAAAIGRDGDAERLRARADELAAAVHARFFDTEQRAYVEERQTYLALPVLAGLGSQDLQDELFARLVADVERRQHIDTGIHGTWFLVRLLLERGRADLLQLVASQRDAPSWGAMLEQGATTIWEQWDGGNSRMHSSFLSIGAFFVEGLLGIRPCEDAPGYARFVVAPAIGAGGLGHAEGHLDTVRGPIRCAWTTAGDRATLAIEVPPGAIADVRIPTREPGSVHEGGMPVAEAVGVSEVRVDRRAEAAFVECRIGAGSYGFEFAR